MRLTLITTFLLIVLFPAKMVGGNRGERTSFTPSHHVRASIGLPFSSSGLIKNDWKVSINGFPVSPDKEESDSHKADKSEIHKTPSFNLGYFFRPRRWVEVGAGVYFFGETGTKRYRLFPGMNHEFKKQMWGVVAESRFFWLNRKYVNLYSSLAFGMGVIPETRTYETYTVRSTEMALLLKCSLFGLSVGNKLYGFAELSGFGSGCAMGIGYRF